MITGACGLIGNNLAAIISIVGDPDGMVQRVNVEGPTTRPEQPSSLGETIQQLRSGQIPVTVVGGSP